MPDWSITIIPSANGAAFVPDLHGAQPGDPLHTQQDDLVTWNNTTHDEHQPWPADADYNPLPGSEVTRGSARYLSDVIPPGGSSRPSYDVAAPSSPAPQTWTVYYVCKLHPDERGTIESQAAPTWTVNYIEDGSATSLDPATTKANQGDLISWFNDSSQEHQPWPADAGFAPLPEADVEEAAGNYLSDVIPSGAYSLTFAYTHPLNYICRLHPDATTERGTLADAS